MAVPTISTVTPATGPTGGWTLVEIIGTNFRLPPDPPVSGPVPPRPITVAVWFGGVRAQKVLIFSATTLAALTAARDAGVVDVQVVNLNDDGTPITGEQVTKLAAFTYARPKLTEEDNLTRLERAFIQELKRQVIENTCPLTHTEYDDTPGDGLNIAAPAELPALLIGGPELVENRLYGSNEGMSRDRAGGAAGLYDRMRPARTVDLQFTLVGVSDSNVELLNLLAAVEQCFARTKYLTMLRNPAIPLNGSVRYEMDIPFTGQPRINSTSNDQNIRTFSLTVLVRGFDLEGMAGVTDDLVFDRGGRVGDDGASVGVEQTGQSYPVGPSPGPGRT